MYLAKDLIVMLVLLERIVLFLFLFFYKKFKSFKMEQVESILISLLISYSMARHCIFFMDACYMF